MGKWDCFAECNVRCMCLNGTLLAVDNGRFQLSSKTIPAPGSHWREGHRPGGLWIVLDTPLATCTLLECAAQH
eukprot:2575431-Rhodomonas_salina.1